MEMDYNALFDHVAGLSEADAIAFLKSLTNDQCLDLILHDRNPLPDSTDDETDDVTDNYISDDETDDVPDNDIYDEHGVRRPDYLVELSIWLDYPKLFEFCMSWLNTFNEPVTYSKLRQLANKRANRDKFLKTIGEYEEDEYDYEDERFLPSHFEILITRGMYERVKRGLDTGEYGPLDVTSTGDMPYDTTVLHCAAEEISPKMLELLLEALVRKNGSKDAADIVRSLKSGNGYTPIDRAIIRARPECFRVLLRFIARPSEEDMTNLFRTLRSSIDRRLRSLPEDILREIEHRGLGTFIKTLAGPEDDWSVGTRLYVEELKDLYEIETILRAI